MDVARQSSAISRQQQQPQQQQQHLLLVFCSLAAIFVLNVGPVRGVAGLPLRQLAAPEGPPSLGQAQGSGDVDDGVVLKEVLRALGVQQFVGADDNPCEWTEKVTCADGNVTRLELVALGLNGTLSPKLGALASLEVLSLGRNRLTGMIPPELGNLTNLKVLYLGLNQLTGEIPPDLGRLPSLSELWLSGNRLTGTIPPALGDLSSLTDLDLSITSLTGQIPQKLGSLAKLKTLLLYRNKLEGKIPPELGNLSNLATLNLGSNLLTGVIPPELGKLTLVKDLRLLNNRLTGVIPPALARLKNASVSFSGNFLSGPVPNFASSYRLYFNCFNLSSTQLFAVGQRPSDACAERYPELSCSCRSPITEVNPVARVVGANGSCYCVEPVSFEASFKADDTYGLDNFPNYMLQNLAQLAADLEVPITQVQPERFQFRLLTVLLVVNVLPAGNALRFDPAKRAKIEAWLSKGISGSGSVDGPFQLVDLKLLPPPRPRPSPVLPPPRPAPSYQRAGAPIIVSIFGALILAVVVVVVVALAFFCIRRHRYRRKIMTIDNTLVKKWALAEVRAATANFHDSSRIGAGGFANVYKAVFKEETCAVKRLRKSALLAGNIDEIVKEVQVVGKIHNRNLVGLRGYCIEGEECLLVYDYMANGSLHDRLFGKTESVEPLSWSQRVSILTGTASGLAYLHEGCDEKIIHRDIKPENILLDKDLAPRVADFGLVRSTVSAQTHVSTRVKGTFGYLAPEYTRTGQLTEKSDVYSFGVLILVVLGDRPAIGKYDMSDEVVTIVDLARIKCAQGRMMDLVSPRVAEACDVDEATNLVSTAFLCTLPVWQERPTMRQVVQMLGGNADIPLVDLDSLVMQHTSILGSPTWQSQSDIVSSST